MLSFENRIFIVDLSQATLLTDNLKSTFSRYAVEQFFLQYYSASIKTNLHRSVYEKCVENNINPFSK